MDSVTGKFALKIRNVRITAGVVICLITRCQLINAQAGSEFRDTDFSPLISRIAVLSIHVRDTLVHDSIFHFLTDKLGLPVDYYPLKWGERMYAGVFAGNMVLEPCGPYNNFSYASKNFRAIFFGVNCESERSLPSLASDLAARKIKTDMDGTIVVNDTSFIKQNIYLAIASDNRQKKTHEDSLRLVMSKGSQNHLGIEGIKEIRIGYTDNACMESWKDFARPARISGDGVWKINADQSVRFVKSNIMEVKAIVFKVKSLEDAKRWLSENHFPANISEDEIALDRSMTFGLSLLLSTKP